MKRAIMLLLWLAACTSFPEVEAAFDPDAPMPALLPTAAFPVEDPMPAQDPLASRAASLRARAETLRRQ